MSKKKLFQQTIEACEKAEFDKIVKAYLRIVYGNQRIVVTDGKDDAGLDIRVFDYGTPNVQYQVTTQKSSTANEKTAFKNKVETDITKACVNARDYGWEPELYFFYSYCLTNKFIRELENHAREKGIRLTIIDAANIAETAEDYPELQQVILMNSAGWGDFQLKEPFSKDSRKSLVYDLIGFGTVANIKLQLVEAYIFQCLYESEGLTQDEIAQFCMTKFQSNENGNFYKKQVNNLYSIQHLLTYSRETKKYSLTTEKKEEIKRATEQMRVDELQYLKSIGAVLGKYQIEDKLDEVINLLKEIYVINFSTCIKLAETVGTNGVDQLKTFLRSYIADDSKHTAILRELLMVCDEDKYLQRICASTVFSEKFNIDQLEQYARASKKVYLDTSVVLHLLCYHFEPNAQIKDNKYVQSRLLIEYCRKKGISLFLTNRYYGEVASHVEEALRLELFTRLSNFQSLGSSRNVFINHFLALQSSGDFEGSFRDYLDRLNFKNTDSYRIRNEYIKLHLKNLGIEDETISKKYKIDESIKIISSELALRKRHRTPSALANDAIMLEYLADNDIAIHKVTPLFVTWDKTLLTILKQFYASHPNSNRWFQLTPGQFVDRYSLLSFSVDQETITKDMLAMISETFIQNTHSLLDTLQLIINPEDEVGLEYSNRFAEMRDSFIFDANKSSDIQQEERGKYVLDDVMFLITTHYMERLDLSEGYKSLFKSDRHMDQLIGIFKKTALYYQENQKLDDSVYSELDNLIVMNQEI